MSLRAVRKKLEHRWPGAWGVEPKRINRTVTFILRRIDAIELIAFSELAAIAAAFPGFEAFASKEPRSKFPEDGFDFDGFDFGVWLVPIHPSPKRIRRAPARKRSRVR